MMIINKNTKYLLPILFFIIYVFFPTHNSSRDAYAYAAAIFHGQELFHPHHLLYNAFGYVLYHLLGSQIEPLVLMKAANAFFGALSLWLLSRILFKITQNDKLSIVYTLFAGSSFGVWRFATENENYIIPIFLSMLASSLFLSFYTTKKLQTVALAGFFAAFATLFHQIHFFWWFGLGFGVWTISRRLQSLVAYVVPAFIVPLAYFFVVGFSLEQEVSFGNVLGFVFREFDPASASDIRATATMTAISFFRTFLQVHGSMFLLISKNWLYWLPAILSLFLVVFAISRSPLITKIRIESHQKYINIHCLIFALQFLFAAYSTGNAEFMALLPIVLPLCLLRFRRINSDVILFLGLAMFVWNFGYGIFPANAISFYKQEKTVQRTHYQQDDLFILTDFGTIKNKIKYKFDYWENKNIAETPSVLQGKNKSSDELKTKIMTALNSGNKVFTNCLQRPKMINRASFLNSGIDSLFFANFRLTKVDSVDCLAGRYYLFNVSLP